MSQHSLSINLAGADFTAAALQDQQQAALVHLPDSALGDKHPWNRIIAHAPKAKTPCCLHPLEGNRPCFTLPPARSAWSAHRPCLPSPLTRVTLLAQPRHVAAACSQDPKPQPPATPRAAMLCSSLQVQSHHSQEGLTQGGRVGWQSARPGPCAQSWTPHLQCS